MFLEFVAMDTDTEVVVLSLALDPLRFVVVGRGLVTRLLGLVTSA